MKHVNVLFIKFAASLVIFWISLDLFFEATIIDILSFSLLLTVVSYFVGDQILLPRIGKMNAVITDFFLAYLVVWIFGGILFDSYLQVAWGSIISALLIAASEVFVHSYIIKSISSEIRKNRPSFNQAFAYEFAEEQNPKPDKDK
ncbi:YndM family protein [Rossellomorea vietnamensis]|uniref:YndM family protein n=1 Tax=Rossellomorea vietnamensis TaxID=218284 RepID=UPI003CF4D542